MIIFLFCFSIHAIKKKEPGKFKLNKNLINALILREF